MIEALPSPVGDVRVRTDMLGCGTFLSPRGKHRHRGVDLIARVGQLVTSPISGRLERVGHPYADDLTYRLLEVRGDGVLVALFYVSPLPGPVPRLVEAGSVLGTVQDLTARYGDDIIPHVHIEVRVDNEGDIPPGARRIWRNGAWLIDPIHVLRPGPDRLTIRGGGPTA